MKQQKNIPKNIMMLGLLIGLVWGCSSNETPKPKEVFQQVNPVVRQSQTHYFESNDNAIGPRYEISLFDEQAGDHRETKLRVVNSGRVITRQVDADPDDPTFSMEIDLEDTLPIANPERDPGKLYDTPKLAKSLADMLKKGDFQKDLSRGLSNSLASEIAQGQNATQKRMQELGKQLADFEKQQEKRSADLSGQAEALQQALKNQMADVLRNLGQLADDEAKFKKAFEDINKNLDTQRNNLNRMRDSVAENFENTEKSLQITQKALTQMDADLSKRSEELDVALKGLQREIDENQNEINQNEKGIGTNRDQLLANLLEQQQQHEDALKNFTETQKRIDKVRDGVQLQQDTVEDLRDLNQQQFEDALKRLNRVDQKLNERQQQIAEFQEAMKKDFVESRNQVAEVKKNVDSQFGTVQRVQRDLIAGQEARTKQIGAVQSTLEGQSKQLTELDQQIGSNQKALRAQLASMSQADSERQTRIQSEFDAVNTGLNRQRRDVLQRIATTDMTLRKRFDDLEDLEQRNYEAAKVGFADVKNRTDWNRGLLKEQLGENYQSRLTVYNLFQKMGIQLSDQNERIESNTEKLQEGLRSISNEVNSVQNLVNQQSEQIQQFSQSVDQQFSGFQRQVSIADFKNAERFRESQKQIDGLKEENLKGFAQTLDELKITQANVDQASNSLKDLVNQQSEQIQQFSQAVDQQNRQTQRQLKETELKLGLQNESTQQQMAGFQQSTNRQFEANRTQVEEFRNESHLQVAGVQRQVSITDFKNAERFRENQQQMEGLQEENFRGFQQLADLENKRLADLNQANRLRTQQLIMKIQEQGDELNLTQQQILEGQKLGQVQLSGIQSQVAANQVALDRSSANNQQQFSQVQQQLQQQELANQQRSLSLQNSHHQTARNLENQNRQLSRVRDQMSRQEQAQAQRHQNLLDREQDQSTQIAALGTAMMLASNQQKNQLADQFQDLQSDLSAQSSQIQDLREDVSSSRDTVMSRVAKAEESLQGTIQDESQEIQNSEMQNAKKLQEGLQSVELQQQAADQLALAIRDLIQDLRRESQQSHSFALEQMEALSSQEKLNQLIQDSRFEQLQSDIKETLKDLVTGLDDATLQQLKEMMQTALSDQPNTGSTLSDEDLDDIEMMMNRSLARTQQETASNFESIRRQVEGLQGSPKVSLDDASLAAIQRAMARPPQPGITTLDAATVRQLARLISRRLPPADLDDNALQKIQSLLQSQPPPPSADLNANALQKIQNLLQRQQPPPPADLNADALQKIQSLLQNQQPQASLSDSNLNDLRDDISDNLVSTLGPQLENLLDQRFRDLQKSISQQSSNASGLTDQEFRQKSRELRDQLQQEINDLLADRLGQFQQDLEQKIESQSSPASQESNSRRLDQLSELLANSMQRLNDRLEGLESRVVDQTPKAVWNSDFEKGLLEALAKSQQPQKEQESTQSAPIDASTESASSELNQLSELLDDAMQGLNRRLQELENQVTNQSPKVAWNSDLEKGLLEALEKSQQSQKEKGFTPEQLATLQAALKQQPFDSKLNEASLLSIEKLLAKPKESEIGADSLETVKNMLSAENKILLDSLEKRLRELQSGQEGLSGQVADLKADSALNEVKSGLDSLATGQQNLSLQLKQVSEDLSEDLKSVKPQGENMDEFLASIQKHVNEGDFTKALDFLSVATRVANPKEEELLQRQTGLILMYSALKTWKKANATKPSSTLQRRINQLEQLLQQISSGN